jgi:poly-gamma-glutamate system protein
VAERQQVYERAVGGRPIRLYVNVGGAEPSLGRSNAVLKLRNGFLPGVPFDFSPNRGLMARYAERGIPVLTLLNIRDLAARWGIL